jgi:hypothetical protein
MLLNTTKSPNVGKTKSTFLLGKKLVLKKKKRELYQNRIKNLFLFFTFWRTFEKKSPRTPKGLRPKLA